MANMLQFSDRATYLEALQRECDALRSEDPRSADVNQKIIQALRDFELVMATVPTAALLPLVQVELIFGRKLISCEDHHALEASVTGIEDAVFFASIQHLYHEHLGDMLREADSEDLPWHEVLDMMPPRMRLIMKKLREREVNRG